MKNNYPKLHNATWPGIVGKGPDSEPPISLDTLLDLTVNAEVDGVKFDGIDLGLFEPHFNIDESDDGIKRFAEKVSKLNLNVGSLVAPIWGGPAMGSKEDRAVFVDMVKRSCRFGQKLKEYGVKHIAVRAAGYDNVDLKKAKFLNISVANVLNFNGFLIFLFVSYSVFNCFIIFLISISSIFTVEDDKYKNSSIHFSPTFKIKSNC